MIIKSLSDLRYNIDNIIDGVKCLARERCLKGHRIFNGYY